MGELRARLKTVPSGRGGEKERERETVDKGKVEDRKCVCTSVPYC